jgi:hypothetical protein
MKTNDSNESIDEGFEDIVTSEGSISMIIITVKMILITGYRYRTGYASYVIRAVPRLKTALSPFNE